MTLEDKIAEFFEYRKELKKPIKEVSKKAFLRRLEKLSGGNENDMIEILELSIANGWQGIFELKKKEVKPNVIDQTINAYNEVMKKYE